MATKRPIRSGAPAEIAKEYEAWVEEASTAPVRVPLPAILKPYDGDLDAHNRELAALKAKGLRAEKAINLGLRYAAEGTEIQAPRTIGECPAGDGRINYGDGAVRRNRKWWHSPCDPKPDFTCWCGELVEQRKPYLMKDGHRVIPAREWEHDDCWRVRSSVLQLLRALEPTVPEAYARKLFRR